LNPVTVDPPFEGDHCRIVVGNDGLTALTTAVVRAGLVDFEPRTFFHFVLPQRQRLQTLPSAILDTLLDEQVYSSPREPLALPCLAGELFAINDLSDGLTVAAADGEDLLFTYLPLPLTATRL
jgi:hypothetical protein